MAIGIFKLITRIDNSKAKGDAKEFDKIVDDAAKKAADSGKDTVVDIDVKKAKKEIETLEKEIDKYEAKLSKLESGKLADYNAERATATASTREMMSKATTPEQKAAVQQMHNQQMEGIEKKYAKVLAEADEYGSILAKNDEKIRELKADLDRAANAERQIGDNVDNTASSTSKQKAFFDGLVASMRKAPPLTQQLKKSLLNASGGAAKLAKHLGSKLANGLKSAVTRLKDMGKHTDNLRKKFMKIGLALIGMRGLMAGLRQIVSSALNNNETLQKQLTAVKGVLGQALEPAINILVQGLSQMVSFADRLYQVFTGTSLVAKYNAKQMKKTADATSDAADAAADYNNQMAGFDVANKLSDNSSNNSNSSQESASLFETVNLDNWLNSLVNKIKDNDWFGAGAGIAEKLVGGMKSINWDIINTKLQNSAEKLADFINGFLTFKDNDGASFGAGLATTLSNGIKTGLNMLTSFVQTLDWGAFADTLWDFVTNIDYSGLVNKAFSLLGSAFGGAVSFVATLADNVIQSFRDYFEPFVDDAGGDIIEGVFNGIVEWLKNVKTWLKENVWDPFIDGFKSTFDIHSPSKDPTIHEMGSDIIEGIFNGLLDWLKDIKTWLKENVFNKITDAWRGMKELKLSISGNIKESFNDLKTKWDSVKEKDVLATIKGKLTDSFNNAKSKWDSIKNKSPLATIRATAQSTFTNIKSKWDDIKNKSPLATVRGYTDRTFTNAKWNWDSINNKMVEVTAKLKDGVTSSIRSILNSLCNMVNKVIGVINGILPGKPIKTITPPKLAKGAIVNNPGRGTTVTVGEAGPEGVIPLTDTVLSKIAAMIAEHGSGGVKQIVVPVYLSGRKIAEEVIDLNKRNDFETNLGGAY